MLLLFRDHGFVVPVGPHAHKTHILFSNRVHYRCRRAHINWKHKRMHSPIVQQKNTHTVPAYRFENTNPQRMMPKWRHMFREKCAGVPIVFWHWLALSVHWSVMPPKLILMRGNCSKSRWNFVYVRLCARSKRFWGRWSFWFCKVDFCSIFLSWQGRFVHMPISVRTVVRQP